MAFIWETSEIDWDPYEIFRTKFDGSLAEVAPGLNAWPLASVRTVTLSVGWGEGASGNEMRRVISKVKRLGTSSSVWGQWWIIDHASSSPLHVSVGRRRCLRLTKLHTPTDACISNPGNTLFVVTVSERSAQVEPEYFPEIEFSAFNSSIRWREREAKIRQQNEFYRKRLFSHSNPCRFCQHSFSPN